MRKIMLLSVLFCICLSLCCTNTFADYNDFTFSQPYQSDGLTVCEPLPFTVLGVTYTECLASYNHYDWPADITTFMYYNPATYNSTYATVPQLIGNSWNFGFNSSILIERRNSNSTQYYYQSTDLSGSSQPAANLLLDTHVSGAARWSYLPPTTNPQLTIFIDPIEGGSVTNGGSIACNVNGIYTSTVCQAAISQISSSTLQANPNCGYVFGGWKETETLHSLSLNLFSGDTMITAKFYKTFRNAATDGYRKVDNDATGGQCLNYVEYETDLPDDVCTYSAVNCLGQAVSKGYATGNTPRAGAIVIYNQTSNSELSGMINGHAAIVTNPNLGDGTMSIHDSNWHSPPDGIVRDRTVSINDANIMGYIYPTP